MFSVFSNQGVPYINTYMYLLLNDIFIFLISLLIFFQTRVADGGCMKYVMDNMSSSSTWKQTEIRRRYTLGIGLNQTTKPGTQRRG